MNPVELLVYDSLAALWKTWLGIAFTMSVIGGERLSRVSGLAAMLVLGGTLALTQWKFFPPAHSSYSLLEWLYRYTLPFLIALTLHWLFLRAAWKHAS